MGKIFEKFCELTFGFILKEYGHKIKHKYIIFIIALIFAIGFIYISYVIIDKIQMDKRYKKAIQHRQIQESLHRMIRGCNINGVYAGVLLPHHKNYLKSYLCRQFDKDCKNTELEITFLDLRGVLFQDLSLTISQTLFLNAFYTSIRVFDFQSQIKIENEHRKNTIVLITRDKANVEYMKYFGDLYDSLDVHANNKQVDKIYLLPQYNKNFGLKWIVAISFSQKDSNTWCNNEYEVKTLLSGINKNIEELL